MRRLPLLLPALLGLGSILLFGQAAADWTGPGFLKGLTPCPQVALMMDKDSRDFLGAFGMEQVRGAVLRGAQEVARVTGQSGNGQSGTGQSGAAVVTSLSGTLACAPVIVDLDMTPAPEEDVRGYVFTVNVFRITPQTRSIAWQKLSFGAITEETPAVKRSLALRIEVQLKALAQAWQADHP